MKYYRSFWVFFIIIFLIGILVIGTFTFFTYLPEPPEFEIDQARISLAGANKARADIYAPELYKEASKLYDSAISNWQRQNQRFVLNRDFSKSISFAVASERKATEAKKLAQTSSANIQSTVQLDIVTIEKQVKVFERAFVDLPVREEIRKNFQRSKLLLSEAKVSYASGNFLVCNDRVKQAKLAINRATDSAKGLLDDYFSNYSTWQRLFKETVAYSKDNHTVVLIVDKISKSCHVYKNGVLKTTYNVDLGKNWFGTKRYRGDKKTPEGKYKIVKKKSGHQTKYYKAFLIDYPNDLDKQRFAEEKRKGNIPRRASIGDLIEIHGGGGRGVDWTNGCVALSNDDMDELYNLVSENTHVTIIGSLVTKDELLNK
jgi:hypothetical protein